MAELTQLRPIEVVAGVQPDTDRTATSTQHYVASDKIRFVDGVPEKIGGFVPMTFDYNDMIEFQINRTLPFAFSAKNIGDIRIRGLETNLLFSNSNHKIKTHTKNI